jgi:5-formyltetrahydrofolate cyclo-ligase
LSTPDPKTELRRQLRAQRRALSAEARALASERLAEHVTGLRLFLACRRVACYLAHDSEIDPAPILARARAMGKKCYLPVLSRLTWDRLWFAPLSANDKFRPNRFGIPEPEVPARRLVRAQELDLILLPLVGFDARGHRLGMGGGYYDKSLAFLRNRHHWRKPHLLGLAYDFQRVDSPLPADDWDIPLAGVVTDQAVYLTRDQ